jgi:RNA polymerase sigma-70 factor (ECF subfamily)
MPRDAFSQDRALEHYRDYLYLLSRVGVNERLRALAESSDIVQQTLLRAHERIGQFQGTSEAEFRAWLRTILARQLTDLARRAGQPYWLGKQSLEAVLDQSWARLESRIADQERSPGEQAERREQLLRLTEAVAGLPEDQRMAVELHHLEGYSVPEVGRLIGKSAGSVAGLLHRGMKALRAHLGEFEVP